MVRFSFRLSTRLSGFEPKRKESPPSELTQPPINREPPMRKLFLVSGLLCTFLLPAPALRAADAAPAAERSVQERLEDIEAYINNGARNASTNTTSKVAGAGPGHNAWMMTSSAL